MKKITTLFEKDPDDLSRVVDLIPYKNEWVLNSGIPTRKFDGTACAIIDGTLYKRYDAKKGKAVPDNAIPCQDADTITGHHPHWIKVISSDKYHLEGLANSSNVGEGTYELVGPKVQSNPDNFDKHMLIQHGSIVLEDCKDFSFEGLKLYLTNHVIEGIVFYNKDFGDTRMCKIRRKDFGLKWPVKIDTSIKYNNIRR